MAVAIEIGLALLVIFDTASAATGLVGVATGLAVLLLVLSLASGLESMLQGSLGLLGLVLLARANERLILAPLYGAALLAVSELTRTCHELRRLQGVEPAVITIRLTAVAATAGLGGCAAGLVAVAAAAGPARSVILSAIATLAAGLGYAGIVVVARRGQTGEAGSYAGGDRSLDRPEPPER